MSAFSRSLVPNFVSEPEIMGAPLVSVGASGKSQSRASTAVGIRWTERWPIIDHTSASGRAFLAEVRRRLRAPDSFTVRPYRYGTAMGTLPAGTTGTINGANQTGSSINLDGFGSDGTLKEGDYFTGIGPGAVFLTADATVSGGSVTISIDPPIFDVAHAPADGATVTLNGLVNARIANHPRFPGTVSQSQYVAGLELVFAETCE